MNKPEPDDELDTEVNKLAFADDVLRIMDTMEEWDTETIDSIVSAAVENDLAYIHGEDFTLVEKQERPPATDVHDSQARQIAETLESTVLGGSVCEVHTGSGEDNYVSLMIRPQDLEVINRMAAIIANAEHAFRPLCEAHGWKVLDGPVWLIGHKATHEGHPCVGHPLNKGSRLVTYETWFDCWLDCIEPLEIE